MCLLGPSWTSARYPLHVSCSYGCLYIRVLPSPPTPPLRTAKRVTARATETAWRREQRRGGLEALDARQQTGRAPTTIATTHPPNQPTRGATGRKRKGEGNDCGP